MFASPLLGLLGLLCSPLNALELLEDLIDESKKECLICLKTEPKMRCIPCNHVVYCDDCGPVVQAVFKCCCECSKAIISLEKLQSCPGPADEASRRLQNILDLVHSRMTGSEQQFLVEYYQYLLTFVPGTFVESPPVQSKGALRDS